jgi:uncharacterized membrane protein YbhN (UPF0104 family)
MLSKMITQNQLKTNIKWCGSFLVVVSLVYVGLALRDHLGNDSLAQLREFTLLQFLECIGLFVVCLLLGGAAWISIIKALGSPASTLLLWRAFLVSVVAKHLPGNVGHFLGRAAIINEEDSSIKRVSLSFVLESAILAAVACVIAFLGKPQFVRAAFTQMIDKHAYLSLFALAVFIVGGALLFRTALTNFPIGRILQVLPTLVLSSLLVAFGFAALGLAAMLALGDSPLGYTVITSLFALSFVAGFLVPGAPGGIGVREATFVLLLPPELKGQGAAAIIVLRFAQIIAELLLLGMGLAMPKLLYREMPAS